MKRSLRITLLFAFLFIVGISGTAVADVYLYRAELGGGTGATGFALMEIPFGDSEVAPEGYPLHVEFSGLSGALTGITLNYSSYEETFPLSNPLDTHYLPFGLFQINAFSQALFNGGLTLIVHSENFPDGEIQGIFYLFQTVGSESLSWSSVKALYR